MSPAIPLVAGKATSHQGIKVPIGSAHTEACYISKSNLARFIHRPALKCEPAHARVIERRRGYLWRRKLSRAGRFPSNVAASDG
jgi:hypothetical protein